MQAFKTFATMNSRQFKDQLVAQFCFMSHNAWDNWFRPPPPDRPPPTAFPARDHFVCSYCVILVMCFYGLFLKLAGLPWHWWNQLACKTIVPTFSQLWHGQALQDTAAPPEPPPSRYSRKEAKRPKFKHLGLLLSALTSVCTASPIELSSEKEFKNSLKRCYNGILDTQKLDTKAIQEVHHRIKSTSDQLHTVTQNHPDLVPVIVDSGANYSLFNSFQLVDPTSIRRLAKPLKVGGIAGGVEVHFTGIANCETLDRDGNVVQVQVQVLINE